LEEVAPDASTSDPMSGAAYRIESLDPAKHRREAFDCGGEGLNRYLREQAQQDVRRHAAGCWVMVESSNPAIILGFYTLSTDSIFTTELTDLAKAARKKLPRYDKLGAILIGRLAVATSAHGQGLGGRLLYDALHRARLTEIPAVVIVTDPKDEKAAAFYARYGFRRLDEKRLFILMTDVAELFRTRDSHR
jgi:ribosomal protein S18 acetylase RimI-like enzyme